MKIAIIGAGNMGGSIARGLARGGMIEPKDITVTNRSRGKLEQLKSEFPDLCIGQNNADAAASANMVILAVKPWLICPVLAELGLHSGQTLVSVAAGISFDQLAEYLGGTSLPIFRLIPNTAISEMQSMTLIASRNATAEQEEFMLRLFSQMGLAMTVSEDKMAAATALTSCGIAYVLKYVQAAMQAGVEMGIPPKEAMTMVSQSLKGAAALLLKGNTHPSVEIDKVTTPGGITIKGVNALEHGGFTSAVINAMKASV